MGSVIFNRLILGYWTELKTGMTHQLVISCRCGIEILLEIWILVESNMIGCFMVAMETNSKHSKHDYVCYVTTYLCLKFDIDGLFNFKIIDVLVFSQSKVLLRYHSNKYITANIFLKIRQNELRLWHKILIDGYLANSCKTSTYFLKTPSHSKSTILNNIALLFRFKFKIFPLSIDNFFRRQIMSEPPSCIHVPQCHSVPRLPKSGPNILFPFLMI